MNWEEFPPHTVLGNYLLKWLYRSNSKQTKQTQKINTNKPNNRSSRVASLSLLASSALFLSFSKALYALVAVLSLACRPAELGLPFAKGTQ